MTSIDRFIEALDHSKSIFWRDLTDLHPDDEKRLAKFTLQRKVAKRYHEFIGSDHEELVLNTLKVTSM